MANSATRARTVPQPPVNAKPRGAYSHQPAARSQAAPSRPQHLPKPTKAALLADIIQAEEAKREAEKVVSEKQELIAERVAAYLTHYGEAYVVELPDGTQVEMRRTRAVQLSSGEIVQPVAQRTQKGGVRAFLRRLPAAEEIIDSGEPP